MPRRTCAACRVLDEPIPLARHEVDAVFADMVHISPWTNTLGLLAGAARALSRGGVLVLYGPYRVAGEHTAPSNAAFDRCFSRGASWGVRDLEAVVAGCRGIAVAGNYPCACKQPHAGVQQVELGVPQFIVSGSARLNG